MAGNVPDWFYRTVAQPVLFALPDRAARAVALGMIGALGKRRLGRAVIDFMGHMQASPRLAVNVAGTTFLSPVGIGWRVDPEGRATQALHEFGVGCVERRDGATRAVVRGAARELRDGDRFVQPTRRAVAASGVESEASCGAAGRVLIRSESEDGRETVTLPSGVVAPVVACDEPVPTGDPPSAAVVLQAGRREPSGGWSVPSEMPKNLPARVRAWRDHLGESGAVILAGGVGAPADAVALIEAGASLVLIDAGLVFSGPGLVKRCNAALLSRLSLDEGICAGEANGAEATPRRAWFWAFALGAALAGGGVLALGLAFTRVLLPYDEQFLGLTADVLRRNTPKLHAFMAHDRGTLAGVMLGLGWLYAVLAWSGIRRCVHGAKTAVVASALAGFASFFSFLGFGYFDTLHAFVAAVLFQLTVQILVGAPGGGEHARPARQDEDGSWRRAQWGQLLWVVHAVGLVLAGTVILGIGMTRVFVSEDLAFLCMDAGQVNALGERLVSVVAHDRATLGGMLWASGVGMLLPVLWCHERGASWLWWAVAGLGAPAYGATLGMHAWVGYTDWRHIVPALAGLLLWAGGLILSRGYLAGENTRRPV